MDITGFIKRHQVATFFALAFIWTRAWWASPFAIMPEGIQNGQVPPFAILAGFGSSLIAVTPTPLPPTVTPTVTEPSPTPSPSPTPTTTPVATLAAELKATVEANLPPTPTSESWVSWPVGIEEVNVLPLNADSDSRSFWVVFSVGFRYGSRDFDHPPQNHFVAIYTRQEKEWQELGRLELEDPTSNFLTEESVKQVQVEPGRVWLQVESDVASPGVLGSCYDLLSFDGKTLRSEVSHCHPSRGRVGWLKDLDGDGTLEVLLDLGDANIFYYPSLTRFVNYQVLRWDGTQMSEGSFIPLPESTPAKLRELNNRAVESAQGRLWKDAQETINQALELDDRETTVVWNATLIGLHTKDIVELSINHGDYPLLNRIFYGDYAAALDIMRPYTAEQIFSQQSPLIVGTVAEGVEKDLADWITRSTEWALEVKPDLAAAHFLHGWAAYLIDPSSLTVLNDIERAAELDPDDPLFSESLAYLKGKIH